MATGGKIRQLSFCMAWAGLLSSAASGHEAPGSDIMINWNSVPRSVLVAGDAKVGACKIFIEADEAIAAESKPQLVIDIQPADGHLPPTRYPAALVADGGHQYQAPVFFPTAEIWTIKVKDLAGNASEEFVASIAISPPTLGPLEIVWYASPFVAFGSFWALSALRPGRRWRIKWRPLQG